MSRPSDDNDYGSRPTHNIVAKEKNDSYFTEVGVAFTTKRGNLTLKFNKFVDLNRLLKANITVAPRDRQRPEADVDEPELTQEQLAVKIVEFIINGYDEKIHGSDPDLSLLIRQYEALRDGE